MGLSVHRIEWDTMFTRNERLPIGEKADWSHEEDVWFPPEYSIDGRRNRVRSDDGEAEAD